MQVSSAFLVLCLRRVIAVSNAFEQFYVLISFGERAHYETNDIFFGAAEFCDDE